MKHDLILFDLDGTLIEYKTDKILPGVLPWFKANPDQPVAVVTNQGGVGLRYWMEENDFGNPSKYPTEEEMYDKLDRFRHKMGIRELEIYVCFAYQAKASGRWGPTPYDEGGRTPPPEWRRDHRKPAPGMILQAIKDFGVDKSRVLFVGDGDEDKQAAYAAGVQFSRAIDFFAPEGEAEEAPF